MMERFYGIQLECTQDYPQKPPKFKFISKVNIPFVDQSSGFVKQGSLNILRNWNRDCTLESYLTAIRDELKNNLGLYPQPPEGSKF